MISSMNEEVQQSLVAGMGNENLLVWLKIEDLVVPEV